MNLLQHVEAACAARGLKGKVIEGDAGGKPLFTFHRDGDEHPSRVAAGGVVTATRSAEDLAAFCADRFVESYE